MHIKIFALIMALSCFEIFSMHLEIDQSIPIKKTVSKSNRIVWLNLYGKLTNGRFLKCTVAKGTNTLHKSCVSSEFKKFLDDKNRIQIKDESNSYCHLMEQIFELQNPNKYNIVREAFRFMN